MKKDISNRSDIEQLINEFYERVKKSEQISNFFITDRKVDWSHHLPIMYDFWENILFYTGQYSGNPMAVHKDLHRDAPLSKEDFAEWLRIFKQTVDELFEGNNAELIKQRAQSIAQVMEMKIVRADGFNLP